MPQFHRSPIWTVPKREYPSPRATLTVKDLQTLSAFMLNYTYSDQVSHREKQAGQCTGILLVPSTAPHKMATPAFRSPCTPSTCIRRNKAWVCQRFLPGCWATPHSARRVIEGALGGQAGGQFHWWFQTEASGGWSDSRGELRFL